MQSFVNVRFCLEARGGSAGREANIRRQAERAAFQPYEGADFVGTESQLLHRVLKHQFLNFARN